MQSFDAMLLPCVHRFVILWIEQLHLVCQSWLQLVITHEKIGAFRISQDQSHLWNSAKQIGVPSRSGNQQRRNLKISLWDMATHGMYAEGSLWRNPRARRYSARSIWVSWYETVTCTTSSMRWNRVLPSACRWMPCLRGNMECLQTH